MKKIAFAALFFSTQAFSLLEFPNEIVVAYVIQKHIFDKLGFLSYYLE